MLLKITLETYPYKADPDGSVSNIRSLPEGCFKFIQPRRFCPKLIHLVILQSLGDTTFFKRAVQTDKQTHRHTEPINGSKFHHLT